MWRADDISAPDRPIALLVNILSSGGAQRRVATLADRFVALGRRVDLLCPATEGPMRAMLPSAVTIVPIDGAGALRAYLDRARPMVLMSCVTDTHGIATAATGMAGARVPLVLRASRHPHRSLPRWDLLGQVRERFGRRRAVRRYARADAVVALSDQGAHSLRTLLRDHPVRIEAIANPVVARTWLDDAASPRRHVANAVPLILGIGRLTRQKDFGTLLRAFALVRARRPCRLMLLGEGEQRAGLQALAARLGIVGDLAMPGEVDDVAERLAGADLLVSSSLWEGLQAVLIEALAAGCPVVATDCPGGARETLDGGRLGRLVPMRSARAMACAMLDQLDAAPDPRVLAEGAMRFALEGKAERYLALFDALRLPPASGSISRPAAA